VFSPRELLMVKARDIYVRAEEIAGSVPKLKK
jgi:hypothetical protein